MGRYVNSFVMPLDEYQNIISIYDSNIVVDADYEGIGYTNKKTGEFEVTETFIPFLSDYFGREVSSVHIDNCDVLGVWIAFKKL